MRSNLVNSLEERDASHLTANHRGYVYKGSFFSNGKSWEELEQRRAVVIKEKNATYQQHKH